MLRQGKGSRAVLAADSADVAAIVEDAIAHGCDSDLTVREYLASVNITRCEAIVNTLSPLDLHRRNEMLLQQQQDMEDCGINTKRKKNKKKKKANKDGTGPRDDVEREPERPVAAAVSKSRRAAEEAEWEVVVKGKGRRARNGNGDDDIDKVNVFVL